MKGIVFEIKVLNGKKIIGIHTTKQGTQYKIVPIHAQTAVEKYLKEGDRVSVTFEINHYKSMIDKISKE